jgi:signal transduction histidine kinase/DNA-binding response OmpR family regulator
VKRPILFSLVLSTLLYHSLAGQSNVFYLHSIDHSIELNPFLYVYPTKDRKLTLQDISVQSYQNQFISFDDYLDQNYSNRKEGKPTLLDPNIVYWLRLGFVNNLPPGSKIKDWILFTGKSNRTEVYVTDNRGTVLDSMFTGLKMPSNDKDFNYGSQYEDRVKFTLPSQDSVTIFIKVLVNDQKKPWIHLRLATDDFYNNWPYVLKNRKNGIFIGFLLTFLIFGMILHIVAKDKTFLYHALFQLGILIWMLDHFYIIYDLPLLRDHPFYVQIVVYLSLCIMDISYLLFVREYMNMKQDFPGWDSVFKTLIFIRLFLAIAILVYYYSYLNMPLSDSITGYYMMIQYFGVVIMLVFMQKPESRRIFIIGGTLFLTIGVMLNAISVGKGEGIQSGYNQVGALGEVLLFSVGLGFRIKKLLLDEQQAAMIKEIDKFKTRFYTNITHEFRTPLTVIQGLVNTIKPTISDTKQLANLDMVNANSQRLTILVERMLDLSKMQSGRMPVNMSCGDIMTFLRYIISTFESYASGKNIKLRLLTDLEQFEMDYDAEKIQDIMTNLVSNALKFTEAGGLVTVSVKAIEDQQLMIQVKDTGIGMNQEELQHLYERFYQSNSIKKKGQGTGLGLAITKELVHLLGGTIQAESYKGKGTSFIVKLPITRYAPKPGQSDISIKQMQYDGFKSENARIADEIDHKKPLALVVEDNYDVVFYLNQLLSKEYSVSVAYNGKDGVEKAIELIPDVVISDIIMPEKDGLELCQELKTDERTSHIPIILTTAKSALEDRLAGLKKGADAYLNKPFNENELFLYLHNFIEVRKKLQERYKTHVALEMNDTKGFELEDAFITKVKAFIENNIEEEHLLTVQLARALNMSRSQLHRKLSALTGHSASNIIKSVRINKAKILLGHTDLTVSEIAYQVGIDPSYFSRIFKNETGITPSEFRTSR